MVLFVLFCASFACVRFGVDADNARRKETEGFSSFEIPDLEPITIIEGDSLWDHKKPHPYYDTFTTSPTTSLYDHPMFQDGEKDKFPNSALKKFLDSYAEKIRNEKYRKPSKQNGVPAEGDENKDNWNLVDSRKHNHPFEDKKKWVSLEPIPWSVSQISKWKNKDKPTDLNFNTQLEDFPWKSNIDSSTAPAIQTSSLQNYYKYKAPSVATVSVNDYQIYSNENGYDGINNVYRKPVIQRPVIETFTENFPVRYAIPQKQNNNYNDNGIITDGLSANFPKKSSDYNRRQGTELYPESHPFTGNGNWVLLSTSKGYKYPKKQRAIKLQPHQINERKTVQLTVLPPLKDSKINMTTSHGGLLQVESTLEPVEQSRKKLQKLKNKRRRPANLKKKKKVDMLKTISQSLPRSTGDSGAVLAGVGAGLIPATMAMFVPLVMNGKKRKKREIVSR